MRLQNKIITQLEELYEQEHGGCDDTTCDMNMAFEHGYTCWAIYLFSSSGAASDEFNELYDKLNKQFQKQADKECASFIKEVEHVNCNHCGSWEPRKSDEYCSNCGKSNKD